MCVCACVVEYALSTGLSTGARAVASGYTLAIAIFSSPFPPHLIMDALKTHVDTLLAHLRTVDVPSTLTDAELIRPAAVALAAVVGVVGLLAVAARARPTVKASGSRSVRASSGETVRRSSR